MEEFSKIVNNLVFLAYSVYSPATNIQYLRRQGKTLLNLVEGTFRYTLEFLGPNFLSNSQSYVLMKFTSLEFLTLFLKLAKVVPKREIPPMCAARGKIILTQAIYTYMYLFPKFWEFIFLIDKTTVL